MGDKIAENFTAILLEIIGYLTPATYLVLIFSLIKSDLLRLEFPELYLGDVIFFLGLYALGYLVRSFSIFLTRTKFFKKIFSLRESTVDNLSSNSDFKKVKEIISEQLSLNDDLDFNSIRNISLSKYPEISNKVYLFMFRSDLFYDFLVINILLPIFIIIDHFIGFSIFSYDEMLIFLLIGMLISIYPLHVARSRFYEISYRIPISYYLSKQTKEK